MISVPIATADAEPLAEEVKHDDKFITNIETMKFVIKLQFAFVHRNT